MDDPEMILEGALNNHLNLIRQFRGNNNNNNNNTFFIDQTETAAL